MDQHNVPNDIIQLSCSFVARGSVQDYLVIKDCMKVEPLESLVDQFFYSIVLYSLK